MPTDSEIANNDPRLGITIPAGTSIEEAAAKVSVWLRENTDGVVGWAEFISQIDDFLGDGDFTEEVLSIFADKIAERNPYYPEE